jgi:hypothetical protein
MTMTGNCDIDFFIFRCQFQIVRPKFTKFEKDQNDAKNFKVKLMKAKINEI